MYNRACTVKLNKGQEVNTTIKDWLDVKFNVEYNFNDNYAKASVGICGLGKKNVFAMMKNFIDGVTMQRGDATEVTLEAGYTGGPKATVSQIFKGSAWDAVLSGTPDMWLTMNCSTQFGQVNESDVVVINSPMQLKDACSKVCKGLLGVDCLWAVTDEDALKIKIPKWTSDSLKNSTMPHDVAREIESWGRGMISCWVCEDLALSPVLVTNRKSTKPGWEQVKSVCKLSDMKFSCTGEGDYDSLVYGIPQLTVVGVNLDIQLNPNIRRGTIFQVDSKVIPNVKGVDYAVLSYKHTGHLRGNDWKTHIEAISLERDVYIQR